MRNAQELSLNLIVVGALALLVLLIIGGILIFGGGNLFSGLTSINPDEQQVALTSFLSSCQSKCTTLNLQVSASDLDSVTTTIRDYLKNFCCAHSDLDGDSVYKVNGDVGPEICSLAYDDCTIGTISATSFCHHDTATIFDFRLPGTVGDGYTCELN